MKKNILIVFILLLVLILGLWIRGTIPKIMAVNVAKKYVKINYTNLNLEYNNIEFSPSYGDYIVSFLDKNNNIFNFKLNSEYFPTSVVYDSIIQSNIP